MAAAVREWRKFGACSHEEVRAAYISILPSSAAAGAAPPHSLCTETL